MAPAERKQPVVAHRRLVTLSVMLATVMQALDTTIANIALPHMQGSLSASQDQIAWVLTSYIVAAAVATPVTGWIAGRYGRKRLFLVSVAGFTVASLLCGIAGNLAQIVIYRLLQGVFGAALVPLSQALLLDINPREKHGSAMAIWGAGIMVGPILGPTVGGWLTDNYSWRWVFYINLPVGILAFAGIMLFVAETAKDRTRPFDLFGFAMLSLAVGSLQMMLDRGEQQDWFNSTEIWIELGLAISGIWVFIVHAATSDHPFVSLALMKDRNFLASCLIIFLLGVMLYGTLALLPPLLQGLMDYPVVTAGNILAPRGIATMVAMLFIGRFASRLDLRLVILVGLLLAAYSLWEMTDYALMMGMGPIIIASLFQGAGTGLVFPPLSALAFATLAPAFRTEGAGLFSLVRNLGSSIGISIVENVLARTMQASHASLAEHANPFNQALRLPGVQSMWDLHTQTGLAMLDAEINRQAAMVAYLDDFKLMMIVTLAMIPLVLLLRKPRERRTSEQPVLE
ncbi:MAG TPA: DHA2 family efflux MFS transporter permease subunit [Stellaceae bacterium]|nr:DHA2 family efflux MFS transporter permease subunit [Stellaceae bacterium]